MKQTKVAARLLGIAIHSVQIQMADELPGAFAAMMRDNVNGLVIIHGSFNNSHRKQLAERAATNRLPSIGEPPDYAVDGCLISYGPNLDDLWRRGAQNPIGSQACRSSGGATNKVRSGTQSKNGEADWCDDSA